MDCGIPVRHVAYLHMICCQPSPQTWRRVKFNVILNNLFHTVRYKYSILRKVICVNFAATVKGNDRRTGVRGLTVGLATLRQVNQESLVIIDKIGRSQLQVSKSVEWDTISPYRALIMLVGHLTCKTLGAALLMVTTWLELRTSYSSKCHHHHRYHP